MLEVSGLEVCYGQVQALFGVSFAVNEGEIVSIVGPNAAGKSTTINAICGLLRPRAGAVRFRGQALEKMTPDRIVQAGVVQVPEGRQLFPAMTVLENLELGSFSREAKRQRHQTLNWVYDVFPKLKERSRQTAGTLSGGEQQMLAIGRAFMSLPKLLIFDEPSLGLAPIVMQEIFDIIKRVNARGLTVLLVEQNTHDALSMSHRAYVLESGRIVLEGTGAELLKSPDVRRSYLGL